MGGEAKQRKVRNDKKREIQPVIPMHLYETISRVSYITATPLKDVGERICLEGLQSREIIDYLSTFFRRDYFYNGFTLYTGNRSRLPYKLERGADDRARISVRFTQDQHDKIAELAYALDMTVSSAAALLLESTIQKTEIIETYLAEYITETLDERRIKQLKEVLRYLNRSKPYENKITFTSLIDWLVRERMGGIGVNLKLVISQWLDEIID